MVAGSRGFSDYKLMKDSLDTLLSDAEDVIIVSGGARGADRLAEKYAEENDMKMERYPADWDRYGKGAGFMRNSEMVNMSDCAVFFWDGKSNGTKDSITKAKRRKAEMDFVKIIYY